MSLSIAIGNALSGLRASQTAMDVLSNNIANVNTPGYTRKTVALESMVVSSFGRGVKVADIIREVNDNLNHDFRHASSVLEKLRINLQFYESIEDLFGAPGADNAFANTLADFRSSMTGLATAPENLGLREQVLQDGIRVADRLNTESAAIQHLRGDAEREIGAIVARINELLQQIANINHQVIRGKAQGQDVNALMDQRAMYVDEIAKYMDVRTRETSEGNLVLTTGVGRTLVDNTMVHPLSTDTRTSVTATDVYPGNLDGIHLDGLDITAELRLGNGQLAAYLQQRDVDLVARQNELDQIAKALFDNLVSAGLATTDSTGGVNDDSNHFFAPILPAEPITAYNIRVHPDLVANASLLNDLTAAADLSAAMNRKDYAFPAVPDGVGALNVGLVEYANALIERQSLLTSNAELNFQQQGYVHSSLEARVGQVSGVNIDEELAQMLLYQKSFAAAGRLIQVTSEMLDTLISLAGR